MKGKTLEQFTGDANENIAKLKSGIAIVSAHLREFSFVTGEQRNVDTLASNWQTLTHSSMCIAGWADVALLSHLTFLAALKPEIFKDHVLSDETVRTYWNRTEYIRNGVPSPNL